MNQQLIDRAGEVIAQNSVHGAGEGANVYCALALIDENGDPTASTITASRSDGIRWITFCTGLGSNKAKRIASSNRASVCFNTGGEYNITLVGTIEVLTDHGTRHEMWYAGMQEHFNGPDDPDYCVLRFTTERYNLFVDWNEAQGTL